MGNTDVCCGLGVNKGTVDVAMRCDAMRCQGRMCAMSTSRTVTANHASMQPLEKLALQADSRGKRVHKRANCRGYGLRFTTQVCTPSRVHARRLLVDFLRNQLDS